MLMFGLRLHEFLWKIARAFRGLIGRIPGKGLSRKCNHDLRWPVRVLTMSRQMLSKQARQPGTPVLLGIPFDANSSYLRGTADAPPLIRKAFHCDSSNSST